MANSSTECQRYLRIIRRPETPLREPIVPHEFLKIWNANYPGQIPAGYSLRSHFSARWVRFHSLPQSKRYADDEHDYEILLERANTVASEHLGRGHDCWLVASWHAGSHRHEKKRWKRDVQVPYGLQPALRWKFDPDDGDEADRIAFAGHCTWQPGTFDDLIRLIADGAQSHIFWVSQKTGVIFAPYDGGADLILPSGDAVEEFKNKYADWLSDHPEGL